MRIVLPLLVLTFLPSQSFAQGGFGPDSDYTTEAGGPDAPEEDNVKAPLEPLKQKGAAESTGRPFKMGGSVSAGFPYILNIGFETYAKEFIRAGVGFGPEMTIATGRDVTLKGSHWNIFFALHPFLGSFWTGGYFGMNTYKIDSKQTFAVNGYGTVPASIHADVKNTFITLAAGWQWQWDIGFNVGTNFGVQLPISSEAKLDATFEGYTNDQARAISESGEYQDAEKKVQDNIKKYAKTVLPYVTLLKVGWVF